MDVECMHYDVLIIGAGPAGLSAAIKLKQLAHASDRELSVCLLEKGVEIGSHILSGAVFDPRALTELIPNWQEHDTPLKTTVTDDHFYFLTENRAIKCPTPPQMHNQGNYIISLGLLCRYLGGIAEQLGVEIYPGFSAGQLLIEDNVVKGVQTTDMGRNKSGEPGPQFEPGMQLRAPITLFSEGARGHLSQQLIKHFELDKNSAPQTYGIGFKETWRVNSKKHKTGSVWHTIGWPLCTDTYGGSFIYHGANNQVSIGLVIGLDYSNPHLNPYEEFQRLKTHPLLSELLAGGERLSYGARALTEGGAQSIPQCYFPGGLIMGCSAGFMNVPKIKGSHNAMKSGMLAAETVIDALEKDTPNDLSGFEQKLKNSWLYQDLYKVRNIRPGFQKGLWLGLVNAALETYIFRGKTPWTLKHHADHKQLKLAEKAPVIHYPKPDGQLTFDKLTSVSLSNVFHNENQPCHLQLGDSARALEINYKLYNSPESRYCPAGVYEIVDIDSGAPKLQINAQNCIHCKTCDIKDPTQNITWTAPEGGGGPGYEQM